MEISRRHFIGTTLSIAGGMALNAWAERTASVSDNEDISGAIVICNHWTQYGIGETFPEGEIRGRWYRRNFSTVFGLEQGRRWLEADPKNRVCHEFDAYFLDALSEEDPEYLEVIRDLLDRKLMELPGGTYGQAESQVFGYESALRQLTHGQAAYRRHLGRSVDTFIVEEQNFFPQLPQLLSLAGFKYASIQFQNSGMVNPLPHDLIQWEAPDGTVLPTIPNHPGMLSCVHQWKSYDEPLAQLREHKSPLIFQWMEIWVPGLDWGASIAPYAEAIRAVETKGIRQMLLTEYIQWALARSEAPKLRIPLDHSNYNNNFFQGGWGYENERTARGSNQCESMLLAVETLCAGGQAVPIVECLQSRLNDLWSRLLVSQNHDPYLAGSLTAYIDGMRSFQSELAATQLARIQKTIRDEGGIGTPIPLSTESFRIFNPCPWPVTTPVLLELEEAVWPGHAFTLHDGPTAKQVESVFRSDDGNVLVGPVLLTMGPCETKDLRIAVDTVQSSSAGATPSRLIPRKDGHAWEVAQDLFTGVTFEPLVGEWHQIPSYFTSMHPNVNAEATHTNIEEAPVTVPWTKVSDGMEVSSWHSDLMRIREVPEPAMSLQGLVFAGEASGPFVQFNQRLTSTIRFETGARPNGTWRFRIKVEGPTPTIVADSPFAEEQRATENFYCARYVRLEWQDRHILWCPSQNTLFRRIKEENATVIECTVFDFSFTGTASWEMRFHAAKSFTPAESMRLAEVFHRKPIRVPMNITGETAAGVTVDNTSVLVTHIFPADGSATGVRVLNASGEAQKAQLRVPGQGHRVLKADLDGNAMQDAVPLPLAPDGGYICPLRPWEIATFRVEL